MWRVLICGMLAIEIWPGGSPIKVGGMVPGGELQAVWLGRSA